MYFKKGMRFPFYFSWPSRSSFSSSLLWHRKHKLRYCIYACIYGLCALLLVFAAYVLFICSSYFLERRQIHSKLRQYQEWVHGKGAFQKKAPVAIYAKEGELLGEYLPERGSWMTMSHCSQLTWLKKTVILAEDRNFYSHDGISYRGIARAAWRNLLAMKVQEGGGTLSQQLARNLFTGLERTLYRKIYETLIAIQIEEMLSKEEILCLYLNKIYMGEGRVGAEEASWFYFKKAPWDMDLAEIAMIVGLFPSPVLYSPLNNIQLALKKQRLVLNKLSAAGEISLRKRNKLMSRFIKRYKVKEGSAGSHGSIGLYGASRDFLYNAAPAVNEYVKHFLYKHLPEDLVREGGLQVYTTIDATRQKYALDIMRSKLAAMRSAMRRRYQKALAKKARLSQDLAKGINGVFVSLDAQSGQILAAVGGYQITEGSMTQRIWSMLRQPGSAIKGFLYAAALQNNTLDPSAILIDEPINIAGYKPKNWNHKYLGEVSLGEAVAMSINTVAVKTLHALGVQQFYAQLSQALSLSPPLKKERFPVNLSIALGSGELSPLELTQLYLPIANGGYVCQPYLVERIEDAKSQILWSISKKRQYNKRQIFSLRTAVESRKLLERVLDPEWGGTAAFLGKRRLQDANYLPFPIAGKTGTVQMPKKIPSLYKGIKGVRDAWFVALVPREVSVIWFGHDKGAPIQAEGVTAAASWALYAQKALHDSITQSFPQAEQETEHWQQAGQEDSQAQQGVDIQDEKQIPQEEESKQEEEQSIEAAPEAKQGQDSSGLPAEAPEDSPLPSAGQSPSPPHEQEKEHKPVQVNAPSPAL